MGRNGKPSANTEFTPQVWLYLHGATSALLDHNLPAAHQRIAFSKHIPGRLHKMAGQGNSRMLTKRDLDDGGATVGKNIPAPRKWSTVLPHSPAKSCYIPNSHLLSRHPAVEFLVEQGQSLLARHSRHARTTTMRAGTQVYIRGALKSKCIDGDPTVTQKATRQRREQLEFRKMSGTVEWNKWVHPGLATADSFSNAMPRVGPVDDTSPSPYLKELEAQKSFRPFQCKKRAIPSLDMLYFRRTPRVQAVLRPWARLLYR